MSSVLEGATVLLAAGGTGGHLAPALAVAAEVAGRGARVVFVTTPSQAGLVPEGYEIRTLELRGFERHAGALKQTRADARPAGRRGP